MAATKRKFTVPSLEELDKDVQESRRNPIFNTYKTSSKDIEESRDGTNSATSNAGDLKRHEVNNLGSKSELTLNGGTGLLNINCVPKQDSVPFREILPAQNKVEGEGNSSSDCSVKPTVGKTFRETFAFLEETNHFKETVAKIKEKEWVLIQCVNGLYNTDLSLHMLEQ